jgi:hypothetical protein
MCALSEHQHRCRHNHRCVLMCSLCACAHRFVYSARNVCVVRTTESATCWRRPHSVRVRRERTRGVCRVCVRARKSVDPRVLCCVSACDYLTCFSRPSARHARRATCSLLWAYAPTCCRAPTRAARCACVRARVCLCVRACHSTTPQVRTPPSLLVVPSARVTTRRLMRRAMPPRAPALVSACGVRVATSSVLLVCHVSRTTRVLTSSPPQCGAGVHAVRDAVYLVTQPFIDTNAR